MSDELGSYERMSDAEKRDFMREVQHPPTDPRDKEIANLKQQLAQAQASLAAWKERAEQAETQLAGCGVAALGWSKGEQRAKPGDWGYSASYQDVLNLREKWEAATASLAAARAQALEEAANVRVGWIDDDFLKSGSTGLSKPFADAIRALITPSDSTALAKLLAEERQPLEDALKLIRGFVTQYNLAGLRAHKDSMNPSEDLLWKAQAFLVAARVAELKGEQG